jgi:hypothetical protein
MQKELNGLKAIGDKRQPYGKLVPRQWAKDKTFQFFEPDGHTFIKKTLSKA